MHLGGGLGLDAGFGRKLRGHKVTADELPDYVERIVRRTSTTRTAGETLRRSGSAARDEEVSCDERDRRARARSTAPTAATKTCARTRRRRGLALPRLRPVLRG